MSKFAILSKFVHKGVQYLPGQKDKEFDAEHAEIFKSRGFIGTPKDLEKVQAAEGAAAESKPEGAKAEPEKSGVAHPHRHKGRK